MNKAAGRHYQPEPFFHQLKEVTTNNTKAST